MKYNINITILPSKYSPMRKFLLTALSICIMGFAVHGQEIFLIKDYMEVDPSIDSDLELQIIEAATKILNDYNESASFTEDDSGAFSDQKYTDFIDLFSGSAKVYDDLVKKPTNIDYSIYADKVYQYMQEVGVDFSINNVYVENILVDNTGFYIINVDVEKIMYNGLDDSNFPIVNKNGKTVNLKMQIDMPDYDIAQGKIQALTGEVVSVIRQTVSNMSLNGFYGLGLNVAKKSTASGFSDDLSTTLNTVGFEFDYRRSLNSDQSLFLLAGLRGQQFNFNTKLEGITDTVPENIIAKHNGAAPIDIVYASTKTLDNISDAQEKLGVFNIEVPIGVSYRLINKFNYDLFIDAAIVPMFSIQSSGSLTAGLDFTNLPNDLTNFPVDEANFDTDVDALKSHFVSTGNQDALDIYFPSENLDNLVETTPNFSLGFLVSPVFHYDLNFRYGIEIGATYWMNILPLFKDNSDESFSSYLEASQNVYPSILENFYEGVSASVVSVKLGVFYKFE